MEICEAVSSTGICKFWETMTLLFDWISWISFNFMSLWKGAACVKAKLERSFANLCIQSIYCTTIIWWSICCWDAFHFNGKGSINNLWIRRGRLILLRGIGNSFRKGFGTITGCIRFALAVLNVRQNICCCFKTNTLKKKVECKKIPLYSIHTHSHWVCHVMWLLVPLFPLGYQPANGCLWRLALIQTARVQVNPESPNPHPGCHRHHQEYLRCSVRDPRK